MKIVIIADGTKTELLLNFCQAHQAVLREHTVITFVHLCDMLMTRGTFNLQVITAETQSGLAQIATRTRFGEMDMVIYFRAAQGESTEHYDEALLCACDYKNVPYATNSATAEMLMQAKLFGR